MTYYSFHEWAQDPRSDELVLLNREKVEGFALHWPAITVPLRSVSAVERALRAIRKDHMQNNGWADIAYQLAFDQMGNTYQLRGIRHRSAANGNREVNERYCAFVLMVAEKEKPTAGMVRAVNFSLASGHEDFYAHADEVVGHKDIRPEPTQCPGDLVYGMIQHGTFHV